MYLKVLTLHLTEEHLQRRPIIKNLRNDSRFLHINFKLYPTIESKILLRLEFISNRIIQTLKISIKKKFKKKIFLPKTLQKETQYISKLNLASQILLQKYIRYFTHIHQILTLNNNKIYV